MKLIAFLIEAFGWLRIVASPLLIASGLGVLLYLYSPSIIMLIMASLLSTTGLVIGIRWANKKWKAEGTISFLSRVNASPELNKKEL